MRIAFIGGGNMGEAMLSAILSKGLATDDYGILTIACKRREGKVLPEQSFTGVSRT